MSEQARAAAELQDKIFQEDRPRLWFLPPPPIAQRLFFVAFTQAA